MQKIVNLLSTMRNSSSANATEKKKPKIIQFYNQNKISVDVFDQMAGKYKTYTASRLQPLQYELIYWIYLHKTYRFCTENVPVAQSADEALHSSLSRV